MTFDAFLESAWNDHGDRPQEVGDRLAASVALVEIPAHIPPFARIATHVFGEHLGQWDRGVTLLESLRRVPAFDGSAAPADALTRSIATLRYANGEHAALASLSNEARAQVLAMAASAFAGRKEFARALDAYGDAVEYANAGLPAGASAVRALAAGGNNLAAALEEKTDRDARETAGMVDAARSALKYWKQAGTWLEEERAEYRLARSLLEAGDHEAAVQSARKCIEGCNANSAPAFEQFRGYAALALAQRKTGDAKAFELSRERALALFGQLPQNEQPFCRPEIEELGG
jgi:tetratricopeptide (TPR) repeat protein